MGGALIEGVLAGDEVAPSELLVVEVDPTRAQYWRQKGLTVADNPLAALEAPLVVLAVKPYVWPQVAATLKGRLADEQVVISIIAGQSTDSLQRALAHRQIARVMPNLPAQVGKGMSVWTGEELSLEDRAAVEKLLESVGRALYVNSDHLVEVATAISGSGPAYQYLFMEALIEAGVRLGLTWDEARSLTLYMCQGAVDLAIESGSPLSLLRQQVTTPRGTTAAALYALEEGGLRATLSRAAQACYQRSRELGADH